VKRISYWILSTVSAVVLLFGFDASQRGSGVTGTPVAVSGSAAGTTSGSGSSGNGNGNGNRTGTSARPSTSPSTGPKASSSTVTGAVAQTQWGPVQVQLTVAHRAITKVSVLQYPNGNSRDVEIANYALPVLIRETIATQSAQIDMVSGATYTSTGYVQSLQSALDQAKL
jgi:uncharacterized protein with FMN-binding domain